MEFTNLAEMPEDEFAELERELAKHNTLGKVLVWAGSASEGVFLPQIVAEVVTQDEFTHDVVAPYKDLFLVFDTT